MIHLAVGRLEIDWGKNSGFVDHSALFQANDVADVPYYYAGEKKTGPIAEGERTWELIVEHKEGLSKPLGDVIDRINLLGHTAAVCEQEFAALASFNDFDPDSFRFADLQKALAMVDVGNLSANYGEGGEDFGKFFRREIFPRLGLGTIAVDPDQARYGAAEGMENLSAYTILHLLAANPTARGLPVQWAFNDVEDGGWAKRSDFVRPVDQASRFLIVTEGSSDAAIIRHALRLLKPHIADFFDFVDMEEGYPFSGTGNVYRFVQGLISISVLNNVIVLYDNDAEGVANFVRTRDLNLPANMRVTKLPDMPAFDSFATIGPNGNHEANINGRAAAIECYLQLDREARVQWTSFNSKISAYHGELINKGAIMRRFLEQRKIDPAYDYSKIMAVLDMIIENAISMREAVMQEHYLNEYQEQLDAS
ncbi:HEPN/Toprim-associated domain-containing protein [Bradyrhizobium sp.]